MVDGTGTTAKPGKYADKVTCHYVKELPDST